MKNVLFIAYHFPPIGGSGVQRSLKYVKYLPKLGYNPLVVTVKNGHNFAYDYSMLNEIPKSVKVYRSNSGEKLWLRKKIENLNNIVSKLKVNKVNNDSTSEEKPEDVSHSESLKDKVFRYLEYNYYVPDTKIRWYKHAIKDINKRVLRENNIDVIYSTSSPYTDHLIALAIKKQINKPWVADFRDPWIGNQAVMDRYDEKRIKREEAMEREVIELADIVINVTEPITEMYKKRYPEFEKKFITITNGFDGGEKPKEIETKKKFTISYCGLLGATRTPESLIKALENIVVKDSKVLDDLEVNFIGYVADELVPLIKNSSISNNINVSSYVEHNEILKIMKSSNINLMILPNDEESKGVFTGKIFDYILVEKPILGIMPSDGIAANLINKNEIGIGVDHKDINKIEQFILEQYKHYKNGNNINTNAVEKCKDYDRRNLTKRLASVFESLS